MQICCDGLFRKAVQLKHSFLSTDRLNYGWRCRFAKIWCLPYPHCRCSSAPSSEHSEVQIQVKCWESISQTSNWPRKSALQCVYKLHTLGLRIYCYASVFGGSILVFMLTEMFVWCPTQNWPNHGEGDLFSIDLTYMEEPTVFRPVSESTRVSSKR